MEAIRGFFSHPIVVRLCRIAIGLIFIAAALGKLGDLRAFALQVHNYRLAPIWSQNLLAMTLPWIEILAGVALVVGVRARAGAVIVLALMVIFTFAVGAAWARGLDFECGCFGKASAARIGATKFFENIGLIVLALVATLQPRRAEPAPPPEAAA
jgi:uncharacterized membrane protein YphA (DoxX/SURF4 family)